MATQSSVMNVWHYSESGAGRPLILLHGIGMSHAAWNAVTPHLCATRRVIAFDIAGFGLTPPLAKETVPNIPNLVDGLERSIREIGIPTPVDIAGNSLGGTMALEAARRSIARSAVAISPPGLWRKNAPRHIKYVFATLRFMVKRFPRLLRHAMCVPFLKAVALAVPISVGSACMPEADAIRAVEDLAQSTGFEDTFNNTCSPFSAVEIRVPLTVAFGDCDWILTKEVRLRNTLPAHTRWIEMPALGHVPMWVDPIGISRLILEGTQ